MEEGGARHGQCFSWSVAGNWPLILAGSERAEKLRAPASNARRGTLLTMENW